MKLERKAVCRELADYDRIVALMERAFPADERFPMETLLRLTEGETIHFDAYYEGNALCGITYELESAETVFVLYLAVNDAIRSRGYGSAILDTLKAESGGKSLSLNVEPLDPAAPNHEQRLKRMKFYQRNGFSQTGYFLCDGESRYAILSTEQPFSLEEYQRALGEMKLGPTPPRIEKG